MPRFVVYEVWTRARVVEAEDFNHAYIVGEPKPLEGLNLCNWHVVPAGDVSVSDLSKSADDKTGGLNYRQVE